jgi:hypothetical protein
MFCCLFADDRNASGWHVPEEAVNGFSGLEGTPVALSSVSSALSVESF